MLVPTPTRPVSRSGNQGDGYLWVAPSDEHVEVPVYDSAHDASPGENDIYMDVDGANGSQFRGE